MIVAGAIATRHGLMKTPSGRRASSCSRYIAHREGTLAEILAAHGQHVEGAELNFFVMLARATL
jgi:arylsulfatase A-like enzyme